MGWGAGQGRAERQGAGRKPWVWALGSEVAPRVGGEVGEDTSLPCLAIPSACSRVGCDHTTSQLCPQAGSLSPVTPSPG